MSNNYGILPKVEANIRKKYKKCVYCDTKTKEYPSSDKATIEHIYNDEPLINEEWNLVMCCHSCNSSKKAKKLLSWFKSDFCKGKNRRNKIINEKSVAKVIKKYIRNFPKFV